MSNRRHLSNIRPRIRRDGWTNGKRVTFFVTLAATGSVTSACASVGLSRKSAYALRKRDRTFASLWEGGSQWPGRRAGTSMSRTPKVTKPAPLAENERDLFFAALGKMSARRIVA